MAECPRARKRGKKLGNRVAGSGCVHKAVQVSGVKRQMVEGKGKREKKHSPFNTPGDAACHPSLSTASRRRETTLMNMRSFLPPKFACLPLPVCRWGGSLTPPSEPLTLPCYAFPLAEPRGQLGTNLTPTHLNGDLPTRR